MAHRPLAGRTLRAVGGRARVVAMAAMLVAAMTGWAPVPPAAAHGELLFSDPAEGAVVETLPSRARLTFSDIVADVREITVVGPGGNVTNGAPTSSGPEVSQTLWAGSDGEYVMEYFVVSADGHDVRGEVRFEVSSGAAEPGAGGDEGREDSTSAADDRTQAAAAAETSWWQRGRAAGLPFVLVLLAAGAALALMLRRRTSSNA